MNINDIPVRVMGPGSQQSKLGEPPSYIDMPSDMARYDPPLMPGPDEVRHLAGAREAMQWLQAALAQCEATRQRQLADLTQIDLHLVAIQVGLERQWHFGRKLRRWSWRLGGQLGIGVAAGGVYRTKLGAQPETCTPDSLGDLSKCRPFRAVEFSEPDRNPRYYARCTATHCDPHDLERAGRSRDEVPRIFPTFSFHTGPRYELTRWVQITADVGLSYGLSFGLGCEVRIPNGIAGP